MTARFVFDLDAELRKLRCAPANPAKAANPAGAVSDISEISKRGEPVDWNTLPDPSTATRPFNQEDMDIIKSGGIIMAWSDLLNEWLLWVKGERERKALKAQGCRLPVYTLGELALVVSWPVEDIRRAHRIKKEFNATIRPLADERRP